MNHRTTRRGLKNLLLAACLILSTAAATNAAPPTTRGTADYKSPLEYVIPQIDVNENPLGDVVNLLGEMVPNFKVIIVREDGATADDDPLVTFQLKQTTLSQTLQVLAQMTGVEISSIGAQLPTDREITVIHVKRRPSAKGAGATDEIAARVYHLTSIIDSLEQRAIYDLTSNENRAGGPNRVGSPVAFDPASVKPDDVAKLPPEERMLWYKWKLVQDKNPNDKAQPLTEMRQAAINDVLSLVKATLSLQSGHPPTLQIHEATDTLIFKGTAEQRMALEDVLDSLDPNSGTNTSIVRRNDANDQQKAQATAKALAEMAAVKADASHQVELYDQRMRELGQRVIELENMRREREAESMKNVEEIERLKIRLEAAEAAKNTSAPKAPAEKE